MELLTQLLNALWAQDYETLANPSMIGMLYFVLFMILFLENGLLPAAFLPGDSLLVLVGVLIAKGAMGFPETLLLLTAAASLGCWLSYVQGRWLGNTQTVKGWLAHLPHKYHQRATCMFDRHGLLALLALVQTEEAFLSWGWRVPFLLSAGLVAVGLVIRLKVSESPNFQRLAAQAESSRPKMPIVEVLRHRWRTVVLALLALAAWLGLHPP